MHNSRKKISLYLRAEIIIKKLNKLISPYFQSEQKLKAWGMLSLLLLLLLLVSTVNVYLSYVGRDFISSITSRQESAFFKIIPQYLSIFVIAILISSFYRYCEERLSLAWRTWTTQHLLKKYFFKKNYYQLRYKNEIDNPDQRIEEDVKNFTSTTLSFFLIILNSIITFFAFVGVLYNISVNLIYTLILYSFLGTLGTFYIGKKLVRLHNKQYKREANFRYGLVRVRDNAESISFYRGEARERLDLIQRFKNIYNNTLNLIRWNRNLSFFTSSYNYIALIVPTIIVAPMYFRKEVEFGVVTQAGDAFAQVLAALSVLITQFERLSSYLAGVNRINELWDFLNAENLKDEDEDPPITIEESNHLKLENLSVMPPNSTRILVKDLSLNLKHGKALLIMGESGSGKSSILRTIAGLWHSGNGKIFRPQYKEMMFLPQKPYMTIGSLRSQIMYPSKEALDQDDKIIEIINKVNLSDVFERVDKNLSASLDWSNILSLGEQQRVSFARLLFQNPKIAFLDEATSALDEANEERLYKMIKESEISLVSVGHRSTLQAFHELLLKLNKDSTWKIENMAIQPS